MCIRYNLFSSLFQLSLFSNLEALGFGDYAVADADLFGGEIESQSLALKSGVPRRTSECLVQGKEHGWSDYTKKLPAQCRYCSGIIQCEQTLHNTSVPCFVHNTMQLVFDFAGQF